MSWAIIVYIYILLVHNNIIDPSTARAMPWPVGKYINHIKRLQGCSFFSAFSALVLFLVQIRAVSYTADSVPTPLLELNQ